ncbi:MAG: hypothetical protein ACOCUI_03490 [bacterium]
MAKTKKEKDLDKKLDKLIINKDTVKDYVDFNELNKLKGVWTERQCLEYLREKSDRYKNRQRKEKK